MKCLWGCRKAHRGICLYSFEFISTSGKPGCISDHQDTRSVSWLLQSLEELWNNEKIVGFEWSGNGTYLSHQRGRTWEGSPSENNALCCLHVFPHLPGQYFRAPLQPHPSTDGGGGGVSASPLRWVAEEAMLWPWFSPDRNTVLNRGCCKRRDYFFL